MNQLKKIKLNFISIILAQLYNLSISDGYGKWRKSKIIELENLVQNDFKLLQNPKDCQLKNKIGKILCDLNKPCGFGCQMHHLILCFITAYATKRVLILESKNWLGETSLGYEKFFQPVSLSCNNVHLGKIVEWNGMCVNHLKISN